eukprot:TRINITY_DN6137_c0_g1_i1.p1 TRINITY_DN6137_c0_g1~~TRINITY_DN6137_c0_g1_i1.p1  ORF type:complete len:740 (-),score=186.00 TRINITY_DN6137_c0_g1_i1:15-2186(-)
MAMLLLLFLALICNTGGTGIPDLSETDGLDGGSTSSPMEESPISVPHASEGCCDPSQQPGTNGNPTCFEGATCCSTGNWQCNNHDATMTCEAQGEVCGESAPAGIELAPIGLAPVQLAVPVQVAEPAQILPVGEIIPVQAVPLQQPPVSDCSRYTTCEECNAALCAWHDDGTCRNYCLLGDDPKCIIDCSTLDTPWEPNPFKRCSRKDATKNVKIDVGTCKKDCAQNTGNAAVFTAGLEDSWSAATVDPAPAPSADMVSSWANCATGTFDQTGVNRFVCHTFTNIAGDCPIVGARLRTCFRALNSPPPFGVNTDGMNLGFNGVAAWGSRLDNLFQNAAGNWQWDPLAEGCLDLDLSAFQANGGPLTNLIPQLNAAGSLDFLVQDDTAVDFVELTVTYGRCFECLVQSVSMASVFHPISGTQYIEVVDPDPRGCGCHPIGTCTRLSKLVTYPNGQTVDVGQCQGRCPRWRRCTPMYRSEMVQNIAVDVVERCRCTWGIIDVGPIKVAATEVGSVHNGALSTVGPTVWSASTDTDYSTVYNDVAAHISSRYGMKTDLAASETAKYLSKISLGTDENPVEGLTDLLAVVPAIQFSEAQEAVVRRIVSIFAIHQNDNSFDALVADLLTVRDELMLLIDDDIEVLPNLVAVSVAISSAQFWGRPSNQLLTGQKLATAGLPKWLKVIAADFVGAAIGGGVGLAYGGPAGGIVGGVYGGVTNSVFAGKVL